MCDETRVLSRNDELCRVRGNGSHLSGEHERVALAVAVARPRAALAVADASDDKNLVTAVSRAAGAASVKLPKKVF